MKTDLITSIIELIKSEEERRNDNLPRDNPDLTCDQWIFDDLPILNGHYLLVLVLVWHEIEKELLRLAARADENATIKISRQDYREEVKRLRGIGNKKRWTTIEGRLHIKSFDDHEILDVLRLVVNCYKHDPSDRPDDELLKKLALDTGTPYAPLAESFAFQKALARFVGIDEDSGYSEIAKKFVLSSRQFLREVKMGASLRPFKRETVSFRPSDAER